MDLTLQDKNELLKAAVRTTDRDIAAWLVTIVDQSDALDGGKRNIPCPPYQPGGQPAVHLVTRSRDGAQEGPARF